MNLIRRTLLIGIAIGILAVPVMAQQKAPAGKAAPAATIAPAVTAPVAEAAKDIYGPVTSPKYDLSKHPYFESWIDPNTGVESFILTKRVAPLQQSFYFTASSFSADEEWLWFYAAFPPAAYRVLGAVSMDPNNPEIHLMLDASFSSASPMVDETGKGVYYCSRAQIRHKTIGGENKAIATLPGKYVKKRRLSKLASHLTLSADGKYFLLDGEVGNHWFAGLAERETGEVKILHEFGRRYEHAQFSPTDPDLFLLAQDWRNDPISGRSLFYDHRTWLMNVSQTKFEPLVPGMWNRHVDPNTGELDRPCHEWWGKDGSRIYYVDYNRGVYEVMVYDKVRKAKLVWPGSKCHANSGPNDRFFTADETPYLWRRKPCQIQFFDRKTGKQINIASGLPRPSTPAQWYHLHPHPQISPRGTYVVYTTTIGDVINIAVAPIDKIVEKMKD